MSKSICFSVSLNDIDMLVDSVYTGNDLCLLKMFNNNKKKVFS